jgi:hypothetical protein
MNCKHCETHLGGKSYVQEITQGTLCLNCYGLWEDEQLENLGIVFDSIEEGDEKLKTIKQESTPN